MGRLLPLLAEHERRRGGVLLHMGVVDVADLASAGLPGLADRQLLDGEPAGVL